MESKKRPLVGDFIIAAIRKLRPRPFNLKPGTASSVKLSRVYQVALAVYTDREFREGLNLVMNKKDVVVIGYLRGYKKREDQF